MVRSIFALMAILSALMLVYASIVPLEYVPIDWDVAVAKFQNIPWFDLSIDRRADWVANALVVIPVGFLSMGAIDWNRKSRFLSLLMYPLVVLSLSAVVIGIEFLQHWFPQRTISQNDIVAGIVGAAIGPQLWFLFGRTIGHSIGRFMSLPPGGPRISWIISAYAIGLLVYSALPFDLVLSTAEWQEKMKTGRLTVVPLSDLTWTSRSILSVMLVAVRMMPIGFAARLSLPRNMAWWLIVSMACLLELIQVPIFTRFASVTDVLFGMVGGAIGFGLVRFLPFALHLATLRILWILMTGAWSLIVIVAFVGRFERLATAEEVHQRLVGLWAPPLVRYYYTSEFSAGANLAGKIIVFAVLGFLLSGCLLAAGHCRRIGWCLSIAVFWVLALGMIVELLQVYLLPFIPDANDVVTYAFGALSGAVLYQLLFREIESGRKDHPTCPASCLKE